MRLALILAFTFLLTGCAAAMQPASLPADNIVFQTQRGDAYFKVELARTPKQQAQGLMYRTAMAADSGMLFDFLRPRFVSFWMKNTVLPLDIIFVRADGTVSSIAENTVPYSLRPIPSAEPIRAVIEINAGRARALGIIPGVRVRGAVFGGGVGFGG